MEMEIAEYIAEVIAGILEQFPERFRTYTGMDVESVEDIISEVSSTHFDLIDFCVENFWEDDTPTLAAVQYFTPIINRYFTATANAM